MAISQQVQDRLLALMRPAEDVDLSAVPVAIMQTIADCDAANRAEALAFVFDHYRFAALAPGIRTPASEYPQGFDRDPEGADAREIVAIVENDGARRRFEALCATLQADRVERGVSSTDAAQRALAFLDEYAPTRVAKAALLVAMFSNDAFDFTRTVPTPSEVRFGDIPEEEYQAVRWKHRDVLRRLRGAFNDNCQKMSSVAAVVIAAIGAIKDERERAIVLGSYLKDIKGTAVRIGAVGIPQSVLSALLGG